MAARAQPLQIFPIPLADEILSGDSIAARLLRSLRHHKLSLRPGDILVVKHKIVSKAEGAAGRPGDHPAFRRLPRLGPPLPSGALPSSSWPWRKAGARFVAGAAF